MGPEVVNKNKNCVFNGPYAGRDLYITMLQESEREFVVTHHVNIKPVAYFTGRETELQDLRQMVERGCKSVLVSGMGGIGKTNICRKLVEEYISKNKEGTQGPFQHIAYIEYNGDMDSSLQNCLRFKKQDNPEYNMEAAWRELESLASGGKLLLFVDNVDKSVSEDQSLKRLNTIPGAVILTSRRNSFSDEFQVYPIGFLGVEQCREIYEKIRFRGSSRKVLPEEIPELEYVIEKLAGKHTITVENLAYQARTKRWTVHKLREELEEKGFRLEFRKNGEIVNIQKSYEILYNISGLTKAEQNILEAFSVFPYIPLSAEICNQWLLMDAGVSEEEDTLAELYEKGWLQFDIEQESYTLHPVFAQFIYEKYKPNIERHKGLIEACQRSIEIPETGFALECQKYIPFAENLMEKMDICKGIEQTEFIDTLAYSLQYTAEYKKAETLYEKNLRIREKVLGKDHPDMATSYNNLALVYKDQGKYKQAEELYKKAMQISERILGEEHPTTAASYNNLAGVYEDQGKYREAEELYKKAMQISERILGKENPTTAASYNNLAGVYEEQGKYKQAEELYKKAIQISERVQGEENPATTTSYNNLAWVYQAQGKYREAEELYKKAMQIRERVLGKDHPDTATSYNNLAGVYQEQGKYREAEELYKKAMQISERVLGEDHLITAASYNNLAGVYEAQGRYREAEELYKKAIQIEERVLGEDHPDTATSYNNLSGVYRKQGKYREVEELYKKAMQIRERVLGEDHPATTTSYNNLAGVYQAQGKYREAEELYKKAMQIRERVLGEDHPATATIYNNLALVYQAQGKYREAEELYKKAMQIRERVLGEDHPATATSYNNLAGVYQAQGRYREAEELYKKAIQIIERVLGEDHPTTAISYNNLAGMYRRQRDNKKALLYYLKAFKVLRFKFGVDHSNTQIVHENMEFAYSEWNPHGDFEQWLEKKIKE